MNLRLERRPRILFVCFADSTHSQSWIDLLSDTEFDVRVFASPVNHDSLFPSQRWKFPTYVSIQPARRASSDNVNWLLPSPSRLRSVVKLVHDSLWIAPRWLRWIVLTWKPDILHTLRLNPEGKLSAEALERIPQRHWPHWVISSWGSDISIEIDDPVVHKYTEFALRQCNGFIADCNRDIRNALSLGLTREKIAIPDGVPVTGGLNLEDFNTSHTVKERNLILIPKAFESAYNKTLTLLEALRMAEDALDGYEIHLLMCPEDIRRWIRRMPKSLQARLHYHDTLPRPEFLTMLGHARVMIATSLSDGTPNVMLEAMAAGVLPIMSPLESIKEWIEDGRNGLLASALNPNEIANVLRRALVDDQLYESAKFINRELVMQRANRATIRSQVLSYYRELIKQRQRVSE